jgi:hypothetical protein
MKKLPLVPIVVLTLVARSDARSFRSHLPPGSNIDSKEYVVDNQETVVQGVDADVVPSLPDADVLVAANPAPVPPTHSLVQTVPSLPDTDGKVAAKAAPVPPTHSLVQTEKKNGEGAGADADEEEVVRVVEADVVDDISGNASAQNATTQNATTKNATAQVERHVIAQRATTQNATTSNATTQIERHVTDDAKRNNNTNALDSKKIADSQVESVGEQEDNDDNDEEDAGADVVQGPVNPHASVVQMAAPKVDKSAAHIVPINFVNDQKLRSSPPLSTENPAKDKQVIQPSAEVAPAKVESSSDSKVDTAVEATESQAPTAGNDDCNDAYGGNEFNQNNC